MSFLRNKLPKYLKELEAVYEQHNERFKSDLIRRCRWHLRENTDHDNWNGGMDGHTVILFVPLQTLAGVTFAERKSIAGEIRDDLREVENAETEFFSALHIEADDESDPEYQAATPFFARRTVNPDNLSIWKTGLARVFLSHRDREKARVQSLADALEDYGASCFVAHDTIPADEEWQKVILDGLETMELMVAIVTDDFHESIYCMQEVGFALGRGIPVISLKVGRAAPAGFVAHKQGLRASLDEPFAAAQKLFPLIGERLSQTERFNEVLISSFCEAPDYTEAKNRFERMKANAGSLSADQAQLIAKAFFKNDQLHNSGHLTSRYRRLVNYMNAATEGSWEIDGRKLINKLPTPPDDLDDIPF